MPARGVGQALGKVRGSAGAAETTIAPGRRERNEAVEGAEELSPILLRLSCRTCMPKALVVWISQHKLCLLAKKARLVLYVMLFNPAPSLFS